MSLLSLLVCVLLAAMSVSAATNQLSYTTSIASVPTPAITVDGAVTILIWDNAGVTVPIGFPFKFYGMTYTSVFVSSNGNLQFRTADATAIPATFPLGNQWLAPSIQFLFGDLDTTSGTTTYKTVGVSPNRFWLLRFASVQFASIDSTASGISIDVLLYETSNLIEIRYNNVVASPTSRVSIGIQGGPWVTPLGYYDYNALVSNELLTPSVLARFAFRAIRFAVSATSPTDTTTVRAPSYTYTQTRGQLPALLDTYPNAIAIRPSDAGVDLIPIGFVFTFFDRPYTTVYVGSDGFLSFATLPATITVPVDFVHATAYAPLVAFFFGDLQPLGDTDKSYELIGTQPRRELHVRFTNVVQGAVAASNTRYTVTVHVVLYEYDSSLQFRYYHVDASSMATFILLQGDPVPLPSWSYDMVSPYTVPLTLDATASANLTGTSWTFRPVVPVPPPSSSTTYVNVTTIKVVELDPVANGTYSIDITSPPPAWVSSLSNPVYVVPAVDPSMLSTLSASATAALAAATFAATSSSFSSSSSSSSLLPLDGTPVALPLGFNFAFFGSSYSQALVSLHGYITFATQDRVVWPGETTGVPLSSINNDPDPLAHSSFPLPIAPDSSVFDDHVPIIAFAMTRLTLVPSSRVLYATSGAAPEREFRLRFVDVAFSSNTLARLSVQVTLHEFRGRVEIQFSRLDLVQASITIGVQGGARRTTPSAANYAVLLSAQRVATYMDQLLVSLITFSTLNVLSTLATHPALPALPATYTSTLGSAPDRSWLYTSDAWMQQRITLSAASAALSAASSTRFWQLQLGFRFPFFDRLYTSLIFSLDGVLYFSPDFDDYADVRFTPVAMPLSMPVAYANRTGVPSFLAFFGTPLSLASSSTVGFGMVSSGTGTGTATDATSLDTRFILSLRNMQYSSTALASSSSRPSVSLDVVLYASGLIRVLVFSAQSTTQRVQIGAQSGAVDYRLDNSIDYVLESSLNSASSSSSSSSSDAWYPTSYSSRMVSLTPNSGRIAQSRWSSLVNIGCTVPNVPLLRRTYAYMELSPWSSADVKFSVKLRGVGVDTLNKRYGASFGWRASSFLADALQIEHVHARCTSVTSLRDSTTLVDTTVFEVHLWASSQLEATTWMSKLTALLDDPTSIVYTTPNVFNFYAPAPTASVSMLATRSAQALVSPVQLCENGEYSAVGSCSGSSRDLAIILVPGILGFLLVMGALVYACFRVRNSFTMVQMHERARIEQLEEQERLKLEQEQIQQQEQQTLAAGTAGDMTDPEQVTARGAGGAGGAGGGSIDDEMLAQNSIGASEDDAALIAAYGAGGGSVSAQQKPMGVSTNKQPQQTASSRLLLPTSTTTSGGGNGGSNGASEDSEEHVVTSSRRAMSIQSAVVSQTAVRPQSMAIGGSIMGGSVISSPGFGGSLVFPGSAAGGGANSGANGAHHASVPSLGGLTGLTGGTGGAGVPRSVPTSVSANVASTGSLGSNTSVSMVAGSGAAAAVSMAALAAAATTTSAPTGGAVKPVSSATTSPRVTRAGGAAAVGGSTLGVTSVTAEEQMTTMDAEEEEESGGGGGDGGRVPSGSSGSGGAVGVTTVEGQPEHGSNGSTAASTHRSVGGGAGGAVSARGAPSVRVARAASSSSEDGHVAAGGEPITTNNNKTLASTRPSQIEPGQVVEHEHDHEAYHHNNANEYEEKKQTIRSGDYRPATSGTESFAHRDDEDDEHI